MAALSDSDPCSYSKPDECSVTHIDLNLLVNFDAREVSGTAHLKVEKRQENAATLAIHARSFVPCQDTPAVKFTYTAKVSAPKGITVLMSAVRLQPVACEGDNSQLIHQFEQRVPIPSYLLAIVAGDLESRVIGPRSNTEKMLQTAEDLLGDYVWGQYDLLILPPSFPFGGMENPCLTFVTPTLLAGDRSLADVVAHEIAHSWTGNLVTNSTFQDFWLNEGHTVFVERKIISRLHGGEPLRTLLASEGWKALQETINQLYKANEPQYTRLIPDLRGVDPDEAFSIVPYEKGCALLFYLEDLLGGPDIFEPFLRAYVNHFKFKSISATEWKDFLFGYFKRETDQEKLRGVDWQKWFYAEGMPPIHPQYDTSLALPCEQLSTRWLTASDADLTMFLSSDFEQFSSLQKRIFISLLLEAKSPLTVPKLKQMESLYHLSKIKNSEIRFRWLRLCVKGQWEEAIPSALEFVTEQGRMKFVRPLYRDLYEWEASRQRAINNFLEHEREMHNTTAKLVAKDLHLSR
ncbi:hypothetical protein C0Q70_15331 [Pomacea canaliculata]|uniref:Peptidase M1 leukotriene A4 hydrolase/aminopeptidase C-terminal domain-containing protein n=1 Tax=Pomacea canaliculata TaxID=400727 RepID=A0A2T7NUL5_POMCA|nr:hypothetical protein C0Q70_15331 [Pomacea canaliculata]